MLLLPQCLGVRFLKSQRSLVHDSLELLLHEEKGLSEVAAGIRQRTMAMVMDGSM